MLFKILITIFIILSFIKTLFYGIYELKENAKSSGIAVITLAIIALIFPIVIVFSY